MSADAGELVVEEDRITSAWVVYLPGGQTFARFFGPDAERHARLFQAALAGRLWDEAIEAAANAVEEIERDYPANVFRRAWIARAAEAVRQLTGRRP